jgi:hypothetical protein
MNYRSDYSGTKNRNARANSAVLFLWSTVGVFVLLVLLLIPSLTVPGQNEIYIFAASSLNSPLTDAAAEFEKTTGTKVVIQSGGSNTLLVQLVQSIFLFPLMTSTQTRHKNRGSLIKVFRWPGKMRC